MAASSSSRKGHEYDMTTSSPDLKLARPVPVTGDLAGTVFGQVMGLVALTLGCLALGAYIGRDLNGGLGIVFFIAGFACIGGERD
jgi:hypothetical protein